MVGAANLVLQIDRVNQKLSNLSLASESTPHISDPIPLGSEDARDVSGRRAYSGGRTESMQSPLAPTFPEEDASGEATHVTGTDAPSSDGATDHVKPSDSNASPDRDKISPRGAAQFPQDLVEEVSQVLHTRQLNNTVYKSTKTPPRASDVTAQRDSGLTTTSADETALDIDAVPTEMDQRTRRMGDLKTASERSSMEDLTEDHYRFHDTAMAAPVEQPTRPNNAGELWTFPSSSSGRRNESSGYHAAALRTPVAGPTRQPLAATEDGYTVRADVRAPAAVRRLFSPPLAPVAGGVGDEYGYPATVSCPEIIDLVARWDRKPRTRTRGQRRELGQAYLDQTARACPDLDELLLPDDTPPADEWPVPQSRIFAACNRLEPAATPVGAADESTAQTPWADQRQSPEPRKPTTQWKRAGSEVVNRRDRQTATLHDSSSSKRVPLLDSPGPVRFTMPPAAPAPQPSRSRLRVRVVRCMTVTHRYAFGYPRVPNHVFLCVCLCSIMRAVCLRSTIGRTVGLSPVRNTPSPRACRLHGRRHIKDQTPRRGPKLSIGSCAARSDPIRRQRLRSSLPHSPHTLSIILTR